MSSQAATETNGARGSVPRSSGEYGLRSTRSAGRHRSHPRARTGGYARLIDARSFGRYELVARLASGGMGDIFLARLKGASGFERLVVIKKLLAHLAHQPYYVSMFLSEARITGQLQHPNLCQVTELDEVGGEHFLAMEYLHGVSLADVMRTAFEQGVTLPVEFVIGVLLQACEGLHAAHELTAPDGTPHGLVHRDVTPGNIFITSAGLVKLLDFGIAKVQGDENTHTGMLKGKASYMSPEQIRGEPLDRRSDVFSAGVVLYEALAGRRLFRRSSEVAIFEAVQHAQVVPLDRVRPDVPACVSWATEKALAKRASARWETARAMANAMAKAGRSYSMREIREFLDGLCGTQLRERAEVIEFIRAESRTRDLEDLPTQESRAGESVRMVAAPRDTEVMPTVGCPEALLDGMELGGVPGTSDLPDFSEELDLDDDDEMLATIEQGGEPEPAAVLTPLPAAPIPSYVGRVADHTPARGWAQAIQGSGTYPSTRGAERPTPRNRLHDPWIMVPLVAMVVAALGLLIVLAG